VLIENRQPAGKTEDSGYYRAIGHPEWAELMRMVQSAVIANGNELEELIYKFAEVENKFYNRKFDGHHSNEDMLIVKHAISKDVMEAKKGTDLDLVFYTKDKVYICEIKDGQNFDTKKAAGEVDKLLKTASFMKEYDLLKREHVPLIVLWNCQDVDKASFKDKRANSMLYTGCNFSKEIVSIDYQKLNQIREQDRQQNLEYIRKVATRILKEDNNETIL
jgi:hypothetical protein